MHTWGNWWEWSHYIEETSHAQSINIYTHCYSLLWPFINYLEYSVSTHWQIGGEYLTRYFKYYNRELWRWSEGHIQKFLSTFQSSIHWVNLQIYVVWMFQAVLKVLENIDFNKTDIFNAFLKVTFFARDIEQIKTWEHNMLCIMK